MVTGPTSGPPLKPNAPCQTAWDSSERLTAVGPWHWV